MECMDIKDLVITKPGNKAHVDKIIDNFKKTINRESPIPRRQEENLQKLASLFLNKVKIDKPIVVNLDIERNSKIYRGGLIRRIFFESQRIYIFTLSKRQNPQALKALMTGVHKMKTH